MAYPYVSHWTWADVYAKLHAAPPGKLWGIPRGGAIVAGLTGRAVDTPDEADVLIDDIIDTGATAARYTAQLQKPLWALVTKAPGDAWVRFPWEDHDPTADLRETVIRQLEWIGEDPTREGLRDTPQRVLNALADMTVGYQQEPARILEVTFETPCDQMILLQAVPYASLCEHHLLPFHGLATLAYIPRNARIVGLSKLARLLHCFAKRLQVQERLTEQLAEALDVHLAPRGVGVLLTGAHTCMHLRGIQSSGNMVTSALRGLFKTDSAARAEFLSMAHH